jgi:hypothetical protein
MIAPFIQVQIQVREPGRQIQQGYSVSALETLEELFGRVVFQHPLSGERPDWQFKLIGQPLNWASTVGEVSKSAGDPPTLVLTLSRVDEAREQAEGAGGDWDKDAPAPPPAASYPASPPKAAPSRGAGGGFAGTAPGAPPALPAVAAPSPQASESRRRAPADSAVLSYAVPKAKKRSAPAELDDNLDADDLEEATALSRQATVRYYHRMNPQRVYPFLVVLSAEEIAEIVQAGVKQSAGERFAVETTSPVEVEPVLPGCQCYPPRHTLVIGPETQTLEFWIVPQVLGTIQGAKVIVRQDGDTLSEVKLEAKVVKQTAAVVVGALSFVMPYVTKGLKADNPDNSPVQSALNWVATNLRPEFIFVGLALVAVGLYFWCRPRKRDQFWDVTPKG